MQHKHLFSETGAKKCDTSCAVKWVAQYSILSLLQQTTIPPCPNSHVHNLIPYNSLSYRNPGKY